MAARGYKYIDGKAKLRVDSFLEVRGGLNNDPA